MKVITPQTKKVHWKHHNVTRQDITFWFLVISADTAANSCHLSTLLSVSLGTTSTLQIFCCHLPMIFTFIFTLLSDRNCNASHTSYKHLHYAWSSLLTDMKCHVCLPNIHLIPTQPTTKTHTKEKVALVWQRTHCPNPSLTVIKCYIDFKIFTER